MRQAKLQERELLVEKQQEEVAAQAQGLGAKEKEVAEMQVRAVPGPRHSALGASVSRPLRLLGRGCRSLSASWALESVPEDSRKLCHSNRSDLRNCIFSPILLCDCLCMAMSFARYNLATEEP